MLRKTLACASILFAFSATAAPPKAIELTCKERLGVIEYDKLDWDQIGADFEIQLLEAKRRAAALRDNPNPPTFENTIDALVATSEPIDFAAVMALENFDAMDATNEALGRAQEKMKGKVAKLTDTTWFDPTIWMDEQIFARVDTVFRQRAILNLSEEQLELLTMIHRTFSKNGMGLTPAEKENLVDIDTRIAKLRKEFSENARAAVKASQLLITEEAELAGLPESAVKSAAALAKENGLTGWVFPPDKEPYDNVVRYSTKRAIRRQMWRTYTKLASSGAHDNRAIIVEIVKLRRERAGMLKDASGKPYRSHADFRIEEFMAKTLENAEGFIDKQAEALRPVALAELQELEAFAKHKLEPWDVTFYAEKLRQQKFGFSSDELRQYFQIDNVLKGAFYAAKKLHGVSFVERSDLPVWDKNVRAFEVFDASNESIAVFYFDPFKRESKISGAWCALLKSGGMFGCEMRKPHLSNVANFTPPAEGEVALLRWDNVRTLFHELGHGLHVILSKAKSRVLSGANVPWDFVEVPSQLNERWMLNEEVLQIMARHHKTNEPIPSELIEKIKGAQTFMVATDAITNRLLRSKIDLVLHGRGDLSGLTPETLADWERMHLKGYYLLGSHGAIVSTSFRHIFSGDYDAGYHSYSGADPFVADAAEAFEVNGMFDPETARRYREEILEKGGGGDPATMYRRFRGRDPDPNALRRRLGIQ